jgi:hypothetical protein
MALRRQMVIYPVDGMNSRANPAVLPATAYARGVNVVIERELATTRPGIRFLPVTGDGASVFRESKVQGAIPYNPAKGQSAVTLGRDFSSILVVASGRKFHITFGGPRDGIANIEDVTAIEPQNPDAQVAWAFQAENYAIVQQPDSDTWIWDGSNPATASPGYRPDDPPISKLANGASVGGYSHGRVNQVLDSRRIIVSDSIHGANQTNAEDLLRMEEDGYWAGGGWFSPPSAMGNILAFGILPLRNTEQGQGEAIFHCEDGVFSIDLNVFPRIAWNDTPMVKHLLLKTGATGPYALTLYDGDQFFRSRHGVQSIRSAAAESQLLGNPLRPISEPIGDLFAADYQPFLIFSNVEQWASQRRVFITVGLNVDGDTRFAKGVVALNFAVNPMQDQKRAWEGLWTLPAGFSRIAQAVNVLVNGRDRLFLLVYDTEGELHLAEVDPLLDFDVLPGGGKNEISSQLITRFDRVESLTEGKKFRDGAIQFSNIRGCFKVGVWARTSEAQTWKFWAGHCEENVAKCDNLCGVRDGECRIGLGPLPDDVARGQKVQFLVRWIGHASLEALDLHVEGDTSADFEAGARCTLDTPRGGDYDDYEYSTFDRWEDTL